MKIVRDGLRWALSPAVDDVPRSHAVAAAALRVLLGLLWLYNVAWKRAPDFGQEAGNGLFKFTSYAVSDPVFAPFSWLVEHLVLPHFEVFGWLVLVAETSLAVLLLTGTWVRLAAMVGIVQSLAIALSVAYAPAEWPWSYWLMIGAHVLILFSSAGRVASTDAVRAGISTGRALVQGWGGISVLVGLISIVGSLSDPLAARGFQVGSSDPSVSLGEYNVLGGVILLLVGVLMLVAPRVGEVTGARLSTFAAGLALLAALSLHVQLTFGDPILGGSATSAAYFFCLVVVAATAGRWRRSSLVRDRPAAEQPR